MNEEGFWPEIDYTSRQRGVCPVIELELIFPNEAGKAADPNSMISWCFSPALETADLGKVLFNDLRHTYASLLIAQGENINCIQTQLGHSSPTVTLKVYAHLIKDTNQETARDLELAVFGKNGDRNEKRDYAMMRNPLI